MKSPRAGQYNLYRSGSASLVAGSTSTTGTTGSTGSTGWCLVVLVLVAWCWCWCCSAAVQFGSSC
jgi:hypothetical protein